MMTKEEQKTKAESQRSSSAPDSSISRRDTQTSLSYKSVNYNSDNAIFKAGVRQDGTFDLNFELQKEFDISKKIGQIGTSIIILGCLLTVVMPIFYLNGIISSITQALAVMCAPFAIGGGLVTMANNFGYIPFLIRVRSPDKE